MEENKFVMSFVDKSVKVNRYDNRMVASMKSGFKFTRLDAIFERAGFKALPEFVVNIFDANGYKKDHKCGMWVTKCVGVAQCSPDDEFDEVRGRRIAVSRAKKDGYWKGMCVMSEISNALYEIMYTCDNTVDELMKFDENENTAIENVIEYGVSNPKK